MRKIVKPMVKCIECGGIKEYEESEFFCDNCGDIINTKKGEYNLLDVNVFYEDYDIGTDEYQFCSWKCLIEKMRTIECDSFILLPTLLYNKGKKGMMAKDFFDLLK